ncbi:MULTISPECIES: hypothetical protein [unclassified Colwellia]|jgi:hypothetical protein|uniref:hypothetical protein n=1 Tax=unclassified Colwellia TaxID=196834 RepID=UPI000D355CE0|nr:MULTISPECIES: hypothetical protein [unclassified Colwellia]AWB59259.1 hypothetical protein DBO93_17950 [Colwellia sp. Arc7-D]MBA6415086.1 hypothetical protein [Colwellia sp. 6M3]|tara:strand:- start:135 stop:413 length:279 start_codon:yes stop_codon:yes gene_type:complete
MSFDEDKLRTMWQENTPQSDEDKALKKVLSTSANITAVKDVSGLFVGWIWVLFLGFGASMYSAKRKLELHNQQKQILLNQKSLKNNNNTGEL